MYLKKPILTFLLCINAIVYCATSEIPMLPSLSGHAVYQIKVKQLHEFSCGYNALFNGCNVEQWCGYSNRMSEFSRFRQACYDFASVHNIRRKSSLDNKQIEQLASQLGMRTIIHFHIDTYNRVAPLITEEVRVTYTKGTSRAAIDRMLEAEMARQQVAHVQAVKNDLEKASVFPHIVHCMCIVQVDGTSHGILATIIKNQTGKGLYIFDNLNKKITESSQIRQCITHLINEFSISSSRTYKGPSFPSSWESLNGKDRSLASYVVSGS